jgi:hypothetical protein
MTGLGRSTSMDLPRREPRHVVPAISICIQVDFHVEAEPFIGRLWDVSQSGACLLFPKRCPLNMGHSGRLHLHHPNIGEMITTRAELVWVDELDHVVYAGALFLEPIHFEHTFLNMLMRGRSAGTSRGPLRNLRDLPNDLLGLP